jgi:type I restriction enzyme S subunit
MYGGFNQIGRTGLLRISAAVNQAITAIRPKAALLAPKYLILSLNYRVSHWRNVASSSRKDPNITSKDIRDFVIPLPKPREQEIIAATFSDTDALIKSLEQLTAKKRRLKQGTAQELLAGKRRLPGFTREWKTLGLGELGTWKGGMTPSMRDLTFWDGGEIPWISSGDVKSTILTKTASLITTAAVKQGKTTLLPPRCIVIVTRSGILRRYLPVAMTIPAMAINQDIKALIPSSDHDPAYLLQMLNGVGGRILATCLKSGTTVESIEFSWLKRFAVLLPERAEQTAIANILSDMDAEISALEAKLAKARQIKQGMMQNLLTGRIRLV